jgi:hypothetical protein
MLVKIGDKVYNAEDQPIMIVVQPGDKEKLHRLNNNQYRLCFYPEGLCLKEVEEFMKLEGDSDYVA